MRKVLRVAPASAPITLAQVKTIGYVKYTDRDTELQGFVDAAVTWIEQYTGRGLITQEWDVYYDEVEFFRPIYIGQTVDLSTLNINSIDSLTTYDVYNNATVVTASDYRLSSNSIVFDRATPFNDTRLVDAVKAEVTVGYGADESAIPQDLKQAIAILAIHWLENGVYAADMSLTKVPDVLKSLLMKYVSTVNWIA
jgi:uncharacterized phiE125 gp8 family phage protein